MKISFSVLPRWPVLCLGLCMLLPADLFGEDINWRTDYGKARHEAQENGRPVMIVVSSDNCTWCKQLEARTFKDAEIISLLNERCIPLKIDATGNAPLVQALRIQSYPTLVFAAPDGKIFGYQEGFLEANVLKEHLTKIIVAVGTPDWMARDFEEASKALAKTNYAQAISLLRTIVEDGKERPVQNRARAILQKLEQQAGERTIKARELAQKGKTTEAIESLNETTRVYAGTEAAREGKNLLGMLTSRVDRTAEERSKRARDILRQAREDYKEGLHLCCLDRCELLAAQYADLPEGGEASQLASEIKTNPEWSKKACDQLADRLSVLYLSLAGTWLKKGQPQQAVFYLERVVKNFPNTRHAETAQGLLSRLQGAPIPSSESRSKDNN